MTSVRLFRSHRPSAQMVADAAIFACSFAAAYLVSTDGGSLRWATPVMLWAAAIVAARLLTNYATGVYRFVWQFVALPDAIAIGRSLAYVTSGLFLLAWLYPRLANAATVWQLPLTFILLEFFFSVAGALSARALRKNVHERRERIADGKAPVAKPRRYLLYGAGRAGILLWKELKNHSDIEVVGFADDDPSKPGTVILGLPVLGDRASLAKITREYMVDEVVISIATGPHDALLQILRTCQQIPVPAKIIPSLQELVEGTVNISQLRDVNLEDLLGRDSFTVGDADNSIRPTYSNKRILVTGAGGSIGSELVRQLLRLGPEKIVVLDKDENSVYELEHELLVRFEDPPIVPMIADIRFPQRISAIMEEFAPHIVFHAAAHKHVPLMESNLCEAVFNNVLGTRVLLESSAEHNVEHFIFISTDKAVNPTSIMGATKKIGEMLVQNFAHNHESRYACVRFGNVLGSRGSVVRLFQKQISQGGPITLTHPDALRYFMTIPEAVQLVLCAGTLGNHGEVYVLEMGNPRKILDLAHELILRSGCRPSTDIEIAITGLRPGEKLVEELVGSGEQLVITEFSKLWRITRTSNDVEDVRAWVALLTEAAQRNDRRAIYDLFQHLGCPLNTSVSDSESAAAL